MPKALLLFIFIPYSLFAQINKGPDQRVSRNANPAFNRTTASTPIGGVINTYSPVLAFGICENKITLEDATTFNVGDTVLLIQMKGAVVDSSNTSAFGTITDYRNAGNYEFNYVKSKTGNIVELRNKLTRQYDVPAGKVQLVRVPYYPNATVSSVLTCLPWDGNKGGILVLNVLDTITLTANIDVSGRGFRGGVGFNPQNTTLNCFQNSFYYPLSANADAGQKGESIASLSNNRICGKGNQAGGGGGGLGHNSGGGGGGNGGAGGFGGYQLNNCGNSPFDNRGIGGRALTFNSTTNKIFMGSGGGAGQADNVGNAVPTGGNGGGMIILISNYLQSNSFRLLANGNSGIACTMPPSTDCHEGMGGGGAGGAIILNINVQLVDNASAENKGGKGADMIGSVPLGGRIGAGGGGGGGLLFIKQPTLPATLTNINTGGANGVLTTDGNNAWGAAPGLVGTTLFNLVMPFDTQVFGPNIDSVRIKDSLTSCSTFDFKGFGFTNTYAISNWQWYFGDGNTANTQNSIHTYLTPGTFNVKLVATDINGCRDSITRDVTPMVPPTVVTNNDLSECPGRPVQLNTTGAITYAWSPTNGLSNATIANPIATPTVTTKYIVIGTTVNGCSGKDSVTITLYPKPVISKSNDTTICIGILAQLFANGGITYSWSPAATLNNASIPNPIAAPTVNTTYIVMVTDGNTCTNTDSIKISVRTPAFSINTPPSICQNKSAQLIATGGDLYSWQPAGSLSNSGISNPIATPAVTTTYFALITDIGCNTSSTLSTVVTVDPLPLVKANKSNDIDCSLDQSQLNATGATGYSWSPATSLNNTGIANPIARPIVNTTYVVTGTGPSGCINQDSIVVNVTKDNPGGYFMPNAFTPNSDGKNDCYGIRFWGVIEKLEFSIYNRWGERIFYTTIPGHCWDGNYKGVKQDPNVFVYLIRAKTPCSNEVFRKGTFVLIR